MRYLFQSKALIQSYWDAIIQFTIYFYEVKDIYLNWHMWAVNANFCLNERFCRQCIYFTIKLSVNSKRCEGVRQTVYFTEHKSTCGQIITITICTQVKNHKYRNNEILWLNNKSNLRDIWFRTWEKREVTT